ncbi:hypothetical protein LY90DRAFT_513338 [Neocallimastix californiae]|uniref:Uncharacterized protein n=1 Tax=Neocallimastix californiae TaxID=1754190 RepID=A0A1Y2AYP8_9FUNG|nr:hypothetical protein LY90DRAFT_513338 [Neocallimastix californiae]|eukprot:ORY27692.1 hypothetical protein LY90DRAFT_513338 [Neocallimastix californiae]
MRIKVLSLIGLSEDDFFGGIKRAQLFEKTDFVIPKVTIKLNDKDYNNFFLKYQCERDMNVRYLNKNEACLTASWVDFDYAMKEAINLKLIDKAAITDPEDMKIINNKKNITLSDFEQIISKYSDKKLEQVLSSSYGLIKIPDYETENAELIFDLNG